MEQRTAYILYASENQPQADAIVRDLSRAGIHFERNPERLALAEHLTKNDEALLFLLVSDNFLKSIDCMNGIDSLANDFRARLRPIQVNGRKQEQGEWVEYETRFQTINEAMQYRDYWYEEWIRLRKQRNQVDKEAQTELEKHITIAHKTSTTIGAFIRTVNSLKAPSLDAFQAADYQLFFESIGQGDLSLEERFDGEAAPEVSTPVEKELPKAESTTDDLQEDVHIEEVGKEAYIAPKKEDVKVRKVELVEPLEFEVKEEVVEASLQEEEKEAAPIVEDAAPLEEAPKEEAITSVEEEEAVPEEASRIIEAFEAKIADEEDDFFQLANQALEEGDFEEARNYYEEVLNLNPLSGRAYVELARLLAEHFKNREIQAAQLYKKAVVLIEEDDELFFEYGRLLQTKFLENRTAAEMFRNCIELNPAHDEAYFYLGESLLELGMDEQAKAYYLQACLLDAAQHQSAANDERFGIYRPEAAAVPRKAKEVAAPKTVLITGATSGIGRATAQRFIEEGHRVIITGRRKERLLSLQEAWQMEFEEADIHYLHFDVRNINEVQEALNNLPEDFRYIDVLINNAGLAKGLAPIHEGSVQQWETMIDTNLKGLLYMTRLVSPHMVHAGQGHILNIGSIAGKEAYVNGNVYCATKAAVDMLTRTMRLDLHTHNIRVSAIHPGHVEETEFAEVRLGEPSKIYEDFQPLKADDVADTIYFMVTRPAHVNIQDVLLMGSQQASASVIHRSGRGDE